MDKRKETVAKWFVHSDSLNLNKLHQQWKSITHVLDVLESYQVEKSRGVGQAFFDKPLCTPERAMLPYTLSPRQLWRRILRQGHGQSLSSLLHQSSFSPPLVEDLSHHLLGGIVAEEDENCLTVEFALAKIKTSLQARVCCLD